MAPSASSISRQWRRIPNVEVISLAGSNVEAAREVAQQLEDTALDGEPGGEPGAARARCGDPDHADADACGAGRAMHARRQARHDRDSHGRFARGLRAARRGAARDRRRRDGGPYAPLQPQPSLGAQESPRGRAQDAADGRADLFFPPDEHQCARQAAQLDRSPVVAPRVPHGGPVRLPDAARRSPRASRCRGPSTRRWASPWI